MWLSSFGVGRALAWSNVPQQLMYCTFLRSIYANKETGDSIRSSGLD
ncbi:hypothetical protein [Streptomyces avermitilis]